MISADERVDLIGYDANGQVVLLGEVKTRLGTTEEWAAQFRRNLLAHGGLPQARFFLIGTPDHLYFWDQERNSVGSLPDFRIDTEQDLSDYFAKWNQPPTRITNEGLKLLIQTWLGDMVSSGKAADDSNLKWLSDSGLISTLRQGRLEIYPYR